MEPFGVNKVAQFEQICQQFYETSDSAVRSEAEKTLLKLATEPDCLQTCQLIIEHARTAYALAIAVNTLSRAIEKTNVLATLNVEQRLAMRAFILRQLGAHSKQSTYVANSLAKAFAVLTRVGWFDQIGGAFVQRRVIEDLSESLTTGQADVQGGPMTSPSADRVAVMMTVLTQVVVEMSTLSEDDACYSRTIAKYRRVNASFRDMTLLDTFKLATGLLRDAASNADRLDLTADVQQSALVGWCLRLVNACLTYDFIGTLADESTNEEMQTVQVPNTWRSQLVDGELINVIYRLYGVLPEGSAHCATALSVLVQLSAVRRSLFTSAERQRYLNALLSGAVRLLGAPQSLANADNYHAFCRLLARLKSNFQLGELIACDAYDEFARLVGQFTVSSLRAYDTVSPNALFYALSFWQRVVASIAYLKSGESHQLDGSIREIASTLILTRTDSLTAFVKRRRLHVVSSGDTSDCDDPLDDQPTLFQQLDQLACIARFDYDCIAAPIIRLIDTELSRFETLASLGARREANSDSRSSADRDASSAADTDPLSGWSPLDRAEIELVFYRLAWLVYVSGALVGGRISFTCTDEHDQLDAEIACRVFRLATLSDSLLVPVIAFIDSRDTSTTRLGISGRAWNTASVHETYLVLSEKLDLAILFFFEQFRKIYVGEQTPRVAAMYSRLAERAALLDESMLLAVLTEKLLTNLKCWARSEHIVARTVHLLNDLSMAYGVVRKLGKLECVQYLLNNHAHAQLAILAGLPTFASRLRRSGTPHNVSPETGAANSNNSLTLGLNGPAHELPDAVRLSANAACPVHGAKRFVPSTRIMLQLKSLSLRGVDEADTERPRSTVASAKSDDLKLQATNASIRGPKLNRLALLSGSTTIDGACTCKAHCEASVWKYRRPFYAALGRLLVADSNDEDEEEKLERFMRPFQRKLVDIQTMLQRIQAYRAALPQSFSNGAPAKRLPCGDALPRLSFGVASTTDADAEHERMVAECQVAVAGLALDLRGLLLAFTSRSMYSRLFDAVYPHFTDTLVQALDFWFTEQPQVVVSALRFFDEFAHNRSQRIQFDTSSPNGCLLFRDVSRVVCLVGSKLERLECTQLTRAASYALKLKASAICFTMLRAALAGGYANFGVMRYYGDQSFELATQTAFKMALGVSTTELRDYPKLHSAYYALLECVSQDYMQCLTRLDQTALGCILETVTSGIDSVDSTACATCCNILDSLLSHAFKTLLNRAKQRAGGQSGSGQPGNSLRTNGFDEMRDSLLTLVEKQPAVFEQCLAQLLHVILNEESRNQYSLTRPLLVLILLFDKPFAQLRTQIVAGAAPDRQERLKRLFERMMENVEPNLTTKNRDRFTQNVTACKQELAEPLRVGEPGGAAQLSCDAEGDSDMY